MALNNKQSSLEELDVERSLRLQHRFLVLRKLGQGTYGKVQLALNKETNEEVAVKTIKKGKIENEEDMLRIRREIHIMSSLRHPHIIHINEVFETKQKIVIVMQYASGGELYDYLGCHQTLPEDEARRIFRQISSAIYYCHKNQICHRDLKLENILLDEEGNAKIADFGLSNIFDDDRRMNTFCGSPLYASPEIVKGTPYKGPEVDCWSLGVLLYTLVYGTMPFDGRSFKELVSHISEGRYEEPINKSNASSLIRWLLTPDIQRRATITDVCKDSWINHGYDTPLLEVSENMALVERFPREQTMVTKSCKKSNIKNENDKTIFRKATTHFEKKSGKFSSLFAKKFENILKTNDTPSQPEKKYIYEQVMNYDVRFILNKLITAIETSLDADKNSKNLTNKNCDAVAQNFEKNDKSKVKKVDSAYVIPIFEVTSVIPNIHKERLSKSTNNSESNTIPQISTKLLESKIRRQNCSQRKAHLNERCQSVFNGSGNNILQMFDIKNKPLSNDSCSHGKKSFNDSQKNSLENSETHLEDLKFQNQQHGHRLLDPLVLKNKHMNDSLSFGQKQPGPFVKTKHHVLTLARLLSLNCEKLMRNSFRMQTCKKKPPGKITIPPTFDPNNPPRETKKLWEEKKELLIFPTVSVSENKEKIQKKIEKIKKAALDKNFIIRSDSKTRVRIEKYIRSQVKRMQDLVREEQSLHASLEHLDEQSLRDMSEIYYCAFGSENTDSGIANNDDDEYFCFLCSKPNLVKGTPNLLDSLLIESIKKGCLYTSNHLHVPKGKDHYVSSHINLEFLPLSKCKSEIEFPIEYTSYISPSKLDLNKRTQNKQQIQRYDVGNTKYFLTLSSGVKPDNSNFRILRSASDSIGQSLNNNAFEILKLNTESHDESIQNYKLFPHYLKQTSNGCNSSEMTDYDIQSCASNATFVKISQMPEKDDGIGDSNDSLQSYIETSESVENDSTISRSISCHMNFLKETNQTSATKLSSRLDLKNKYDGEYEVVKIKKDEQGAIIANSLDSTSWITDFKNENGFVKNKKLKCLNKVTSLQDERKLGEKVNYDSSNTEFERFLWNACKEHFRENGQNYPEYSSSPNLNYYSLDRKAKFKNRNSRSMDFIFVENSNDVKTKGCSDFSLSVEKDSSEVNSTALKNALKYSNVRKNLPDRSSRHLNRTKSVCNDMLKDNDMEDIMLRIRGERKLSLENMTLDPSNRTPLPCSSNFLNGLDKRDHGGKAGRSSNRKHYKNNFPINKKSDRKKTEYKKSFLQLLALKRIQEAEKELDRTHRSDQLNIEDENSGSLLEALKTHGYKNVISQRFQVTDNDLLDPFQTKYLKSPRNLRAELDRLNYVYYKILPRYTLDPYEECNYLYNEFDPVRSTFDGQIANPFYGMQIDFRNEASKQHMYDWLDTSQIDEYLMTKRLDSMHFSEDITPATEIRRCCTQWGRENSRSIDNEELKEPQDTTQEFLSSNTPNIYPKNKDFTYLNEAINSNYERHQISPTVVDDENPESVHDRIWRKSFYSRFNNRALSRKQRPSLAESESISENRLGHQNGIYNSLKSEKDKNEIPQWDFSKKIFHTKRSKKHSQSLDKLESSTSIRKKYNKSTNESNSVFGNEDHCSNKNLMDDCKTALGNEEPNH